MNYIDYEWIDDPLENEKYMPYEEPYYTQKIFYDDAGNPISRHPCRKSKVYCEEYEEYQDEYYDGEYPDIYV